MSNRQAAWETAMGMRGYVGSPAWLEDRRDARRQGGSFFRPESEEAEERASVTGEDTTCCNCWHGFSQHTNGRCPKQ